MIISSNALLDGFVFTAGLDFQSPDHSLNPVPGGPAIAPCFCVSLDLFVAN